jgi:hypothetical protein
MVIPSAVLERSPKGLDAMAQEQFLRLLPAIRRSATIAFQRYAWAARQELVAETVCNALVAFARLVARGKSEFAYATPLARFAIRQVLAGRRVGGRLNVDDVGSEYCRWQRDLRRLPLHKLDAATGEWQELVLEDRRASPCDLAITRLDVKAWLDELPSFKRRVAECLATGERTQDAAERFQVTPGRLSQLRQELKKSWDEFQSDFRRPDGKQLRIYRK